jgi:thiamine biosynthesis lipoprotein
MWWNSACGRAERRRAAALVAACALATSACNPPAGTQQRLIPVFGTIVQVEVAGGEAERNAAALDALEDLYREIDVDWRSFGPGELGRANALLGQGRPVSLSPALRRIVARSLEIHELSAGLFDPRVGPLVALWGFQDLARDTPNAPPDAAMLEQARRTAIDSAVLHLEEDRLWSESPVGLELAGIAKGSALAVGARLLRERGVRNALIVAGGDITAVGGRGDRPWIVGIRDPLKPGVLGRVELADGETIASSGTYERNFRAGGRLFHHLIDPRTGTPATGTAGTTVIDPDAELANAAAAALLIGGASRFDELTGRMGVATALLVTDSGELRLTPAMSRRLRSR